MGSLLSSAKMLLDSKSKLEAQALSLVAFLDDMLYPDITNLIMQFVGRGCTDIQFQNIIKHHLPLATYKRIECHDICVQSNFVQLYGSVEFAGNFRLCFVRWTRMGVVEHVAKHGIAVEPTLPETKIHDKFRQWVSSPYLLDDTIKIHETLASGSVFVTRRARTHFTIEDRDDVGRHIHNTPRFRK